VGFVSFVVKIVPFVGQAQVDFRAFVVIVD
jgi:hypothetical protein